MQIEVKDDVVKLLKDVIGDGVADNKSKLKDYTSVDTTDLDMINITTCVNNINQLSGIIDQINIKEGFGGVTYGQSIKDEESEE